MEIVNGNLLAQEIKEELKQSIKFEMIKPSLAVIEVDTNEDDKYLKELDKVCNEVGIYFRHFKYDKETSELTIINKIKELNNDDYVNGIMIKTPLPDGYNEKRLFNTIINSKDVDGVTDINVGRLNSGRKTLVPATALAIMEILNRNSVELEGKHVVLVGRGKLTCKPLIQLLLRENATVTVCHSKTEDLEKYTKDADILISATGVSKLIKADMVKDGAVVIDVGVSYNNGKISGDTDFNKVSKVASLITPTPGGVGPISIAMIVKNTIYCYQNKKK